MHLKNIYMETERQNYRNSQMLATSKWVFFSVKMHCHDDKEDDDNDDLTFYQDSFSFL